jgi:hypothetical protein
MLLTQKSAFAEFFNEIGTSRKWGARQQCGCERTFSPLR